MEAGANVSVIIVTFNNAATIASCLESVLQQEAPPSKEIIVVDNASSDDTVEVVAKNYGNRVKLVQSSRNGGFASGVNMGIRASQGHAIFLLNPDAKLVTPNLIRALYKLVANNPEIGAVSPSIVAANGEWMGWGYFPGIREVFFEIFLPAALKRKLAPVADWLKMRPPVMQQLKPKWVESGSGGAMMFQRDRIEKVGRWDESYFMYLEDHDFCFRLAKAGYRSFFAADHIVEHTRMHSSHHHPDRLLWLSRRHYITHRLFFRKHGKHIAGAILRISWYAFHLLRWLSLVCLGKKNTENAFVHRYWIRALFHGGEP